MKSMNNNEFNYILYAGGFAVIWFLLLVPNIDKIGLANASPYTHFILFNIGLVIFFQIFLKSTALHQHIHFKTALGLVLVITAIDIWLPPMMVSSQGIISTGNLTLGSSGADYIIGYSLTSLGLHGPVIYYITYLLIPVTMLVLASRLMHNFVKNI